MSRHFFTMQCKPGCEKEYMERHNAVFPELLSALKRVGVSNYSIFMKDNQLFAYMVVDNFQRAMDELAKDLANQRWQEYMKDIMVTNDTGGIIEVIDNEVFFLD